MSEAQEAEIKSRYGNRIVERFKLTGELRRPRKGEWYWWTGSKGPAACQADDERPFNAPILVERTDGRSE
jgi:hypothetical protein